MVEMRNNSQEKNETPEIITVTMILEDLENGEDRNAIKAKYNLEAWEVKQMFEHPTLKGKKARRVKKLSFDFVDDTIDENQIDLEDAIKEEENDSMKDVMIDEMNGRREMDIQDQLSEMASVASATEDKLMEQARTESEVLDNICTEHEEVTELQNELGMKALPSLKDRIKIVDSIGKFDELSGEEADEDTIDEFTEKDY